MFHIPLSRFNRLLPYLKKSIFICFLLVGSCSRNCKTSRESLNSFASYFFESYECGDDSLAVKVVSVPGLDASGFTFDVAIDGRAKDKTSCGVGIETSKCGEQLGRKKNHFKRITCIVADGVGGWRNQGIDSGLYSSALVKHIASSDADNPLQMMRDGYDKTDPIASSTVCVARIDQQTLTWANLGDSGLRVVRNKQFVVVTKEQQHGFNHPYQLGFLSADRPEHADCGTYQLKKGDILAIASDGVWDNLDGKELIDCMNVNCSAKEIVNSVLTKALKNASNPSKRSYFAKKAEAAYNANKQDKAAAICKDHKGGKLDDVSMVVVVVR